jgi:hypothetical protein
VNISIYCNNDDGPGDDYADVFVDFTGVALDYGDIAQHTSWSYDTIDLGSRTATQVNNARVFFIHQKQAQTDDVRIDHVRIGVSQADDDYELDLEVQWTNVDFDEANEELCIYGGTMDSESLQVDVWNGSSWQNVIASLSSGWNNVTVTSYLITSTFTIRFKGGTETSDSSQDSWAIDATMLHVWS